ncbi:cell division protein FtsQ/DivIB [Paenibacillus sp. GCM10027626]|uniref:cell division protein FtsQ/DivIB n=1 Tax=Paenibacillus sp. GCM10027626 TaxID=3273411 RepID=UPI003637589E
MPTKVPVLREPARKRRGGKKLLTVLLLLFIVILAVLFFNSSISKISSIVIEGQRFTSRADIQQAAGITVGGAYFSVSAKTVEERIMSIKTIEKVSVEKSFPGDVVIRVTEHPAVAFELSPQGQLTAILANGTTIAAGADVVVDKPILSGWQEGDPYKAELSKQLAALPAASLSDISEITPSPSKAYPDRIRIYTRTRFEVITAVSLLKDKIDALNAVVEIQEPGLVTMLLADTYVPFASSESGNGESN